ncbi:MAG: hypothetical protein R3B48_27805 [Kofleriaceae bacterium]
MKRSTSLSAILVASIASALLPGCLDPGQDDGGAPRFEEGTEALSQPSPSSTVRIARVLGPQLEIQERTFDYLPTSYVVQPGGVDQVVMAGDRVVALRPNGSVVAKDGAVGAAWTTVAAPGSAVKVVAAGNTIATLSSTGRVRIKRGALSEPWVVAVGAGAKQVDLAGCGVLPSGGTLATALAACDAASRIGYIDASNRFYARTLASPTWTLMASNVASISMAGTGIGVLTTAGSFLVKDGALTAAWTTVAQGVKRIAVGGFTTDHPYAYVTNAGDLYVRRLQEPAYSLLASGDPTINLFASALAMRQASGALSLMVPNTSGTPRYTPWVSQGTGRDLTLSRYFVTLDVSRTSGPSITTVVLAE